MPTGRRRGPKTRGARRGRGGGTNWGPKYNRPQKLRTQIGLPTEANVRLKYAEYQTLTSAATFKNYRWNPNAAYDVDPVLGSTSTPFFAEWAGIYNFYRVIGYRYRITVVNKEVFPVTYVVINDNTDPGTGGTLLGLGGNPKTQSATVAGTAGPCRHVFKGSYRIADVVGSRSVENDDNFAALTNTVPANRTWLTIGADTTSGSVLTNGFVVNVEIIMQIRFYEPKLVAI